MPYLGIFELEFSKIIVICEISTFRFVKNDFLTDTVNGLGLDLTLFYEVCSFIFSFY